MEERDMICIPFGMFQELLEMKGRVDAFAGHVNAEEYQLSREDCAAMLGFSLDKKETN